MKLFISHSHARKNITKALCELLKANNIPYWVSFNRILGGQTWDGEVIQNMRNASLVLLIMTPEAATSQNVEKEFKFALNKNIPILPVTVGCAMPETFSFHLMNTLTLDYATDDAFQVSLIRSICAALGLPCDEDNVVTVALPPLDAAADTPVVPVIPEKPAADTSKTVPLKKLWIPLIAGGMAVILLVVLLLFQSCSNGTPADNGVTTTTTTASVNNETITTTEAPATTTDATTTATEAPTTTAAPTTTNTDSIDKTYNQVPDLYRQELDNFIKSDSKVGHTDIVKVGDSKTPHLAKVWTYIASYSSDTRIATVEGNEITGVSPGVAYVVLISSMGKTDIYKITVID